MLQNSENNTPSGKVGFKDGNIDFTPLPDSDHYLRKLGWFDFKIVYNIKQCIIAFQIPFKIFIFYRVTVSFKQII